MSYKRGNKISSGGPNLKRSGQSKAVTDKNELGNQLAATSHENRRTEVNNNNGAHVVGEIVRILCADLENRVYVYDGKTSGCPNAWLKCYECYATLKGWNSATRSVAMPQLIAAIPAWTGIGLV
jgi:hypothetical protein